MRTPLSMIAPVAVLAASAAPAQDTAILALVDRFEATRLRYDPVALAATLAPDYEEISPVGTVDPRTAVLGFYTPAARRPAPAMTADQTVVHARGDVALVTRRQSIALPGGATRRLRVRYVARRDGSRQGDRWQLVSAQYTPVPPVRAG